MASAEKAMPNRIFFKTVPPVGLSLERFTAVLQSREELLIHGVLAGIHTGFFISRKERFESLVGCATVTADV